MRNGLSTLIARWSIGLVVVVLCAQVQAAGSPVLESAVTEWLKCLSPQAAKLEAPAYPGDALKINAGAVVKARIKFRNASDAPAIDVYYNSGGLQSFEQAVRDRVVNYRLPCMPEGAAAVEVVQTFTFSSHDLRHATRGEVEEEPGATACRFVAGTDQLPFYPRSRSMGTDRGVVVVSMTFNAPEQPPSTKIVYRNGANAFAQAAVNRVAQYRLDCTGGPYTPLTALQTFRFVMEGSERFGLQNLALKQFVGALRDVEQQRVRFDLNALGCPFDVRFSLYRPHADNEVDEVGKHVPARKPFVQWLRSVELKIPREAYDDVVGQPINVSVPCGELDLT